MKKRNRRFLTSSVILSGLLMSQLPGIPAEAATIEADANVNVRDDGSVSADRIDCAGAGQTATVLGSKDGWYLIEIGGTQGFTFHGFWSIQTLTSLEEASARQAPDQLSPTVFRVPAGTEANALGRTGEWILIEKNGQQGFSHKTYWDADELLYSQLPAVEDLSSVEAPQATDDPVFEALPAMAEMVILYEALPGYGSPADAAKGINATGPQEPGTYWLLETESGMYRLSQGQAGPGFWIDPARLNGLAEEQYAVCVPLPGHRDAMSAAASKEAAVTVTKGIYYIYRRYDGMYNVSTSRSVPGAWIDPARNARKETDPIGDQVIAEAVGLLGAPYLLGAESWEEGGFDCSGVTHFSYGQVGISLPRRACQQWEGIPDKVSEPRPGDIIAFEKDGEVYHVGLYIGDNKMIHAPKPGAFVKISDLGWWVENSTVKGFLRPAAGPTP